MKSISIFILFVFVLGSIDTANLKIKNMLTQDVETNISPTRTTTQCATGEEAFKASATADSQCRNSTSCTTANCGCIGYEVVAGNCVKSQNYA